MNTLAPIVLFVYNRPWHTRQTLEALSKNLLADKSKLFIYADGPKENASDEQIQKTKEVRTLLREQKWCGEVEIIEREKNMGLSNSIIAGITEIVNKYGRIIVLEDDIVTSQGFLKYMNEGLIVFEKSGNVFCINGYMFPVDYAEKKNILLPYFFCWGWATWEEKWSKFESESDRKDYVIRNVHLQRRFNLADFDYVSILENSTMWDILWYYSVFKRNGLGVFPTHSLVNNIGFDGSGIHNHNSKFLQNFQVENIDIQVQYTEEIDLKFYNELLVYFSEKNISFGIKTFFKKLIKNVNP